MKANTKIGDDGIIMGALTDEEYEAIRAQREEWRQAIRDLRELLPDEAE